jgi:hypothetical protein
MMSAAIVIDTSYGLPALIDHADIVKARPMLMVVVFTITSVATVPNE